MLITGPISSICDVLLFFAMYKVLHNDAETFHTGWFVASMLTQIVVIHFIRTQKKPFVESNVSWQLLCSTVFAGLVSVILPYIKIGGYVGLVPLSLAFWVLLICVIGIYVGLIGIVKRFIIKKYGEWL